MTSPPTPNSAVMSVWRGIAAASHINILFQYKLPESQFNGSYDTIRINVREGMTETIRALKDLELITDADLVTNRERYP